MTSLLSPSRVAEVGSRLQFRTHDGGGGTISLAPSVSRTPDANPVRIRSPKEKVLVQKSLKKSPSKSLEVQQTAKANGSNVEASASSSSSSPCAPSSSLFVQPRTAAQSDQEEVKEFEKPFYFESDHVALKGNADYQSFLKTVCILEAQRMKAIDDLDKLVKAQQDALKDPIAFVRKLQNKEDLKLPKPLNVAEVPSVNWDQYSGSIALEQKHRHRTRLLQSGRFFRSALHCLADSACDSHQLCTLYCNPHLQRAPLITQAEVCVQDHCGTLVFHSLKH
jgi:hypothetical protein